MSQLLMLPAELRNQIYGYLLVQPISTTHNSIVYLTTTKSTQRTRRICANILRTCRQVNEEASPILYGQNLFAAHPSLLATLPSLITHIYPRHEQLPPVLCTRRIAMIRRFRIAVRLDVDPRFDSEMVEKSFSGIDELLVIVYQAMYGGNDFSVLALFEGVRDVKRARVGGSVGNGRYANWLEQRMMTASGSAASDYVEINDDSPAVQASTWIDR